MKTIQVQVSITLGDDAARAVAELLVPALKQVATAPNIDADERREARLRASQNALFAGQNLPEDQGLLIDTREASRLLKISPRTLWGMYTSGEMPKPIRIGRAIRFSYDALKEWVEAGCPKVRQKKN